ncbi:GtrA family protein [Candidatus Woesearchaeota archaeon]|nr:GtrA family protein [Candidatus Woesearchaeota archaeon]
MRKFLDTAEDFFSRFVPEKLRGQYSMLFRYGVFVFGGFIGLGFYYAGYRLAANRGIPLGFSLAAGLTPAIIFTFLYHSFITFDERSNWKAKFIKFIPIQVIISALNWLISWQTLSHFKFPDLVVGRYRFPDFPAIFVITLVLSLLNFAVTKVLVFKRKHHEKAA